MKNSAGMMTISDMKTGVIEASLKDFENQN